MRLAALRMTQKEFAEKIGCTEAVIRKWESRGATATLAGEYAAAMDTLLGRLDEHQRQRFEASMTDIPGKPVALPTPLRSVDADGFETGLEIAARIQRLGDLHADDDIAAVLALTVDDLVDRYELEGPRVLAPEAVAARRRVEELLQQRRHPAQIAHLYRLAGQLSGVLGYMAVNRGMFGRAKMYCREASAIATRTEDRDLQAWVLGTESFCAYYEGRFMDSVALAREGIRLSGQSPQSIRLFSNGLARALGKLGDAAGVAEAIDRATEIATRHKTGLGLTPALTFAPYGEARLMANAATAYLSAGDYEQALQFGQYVEDRVDESDSVWSRSLVRLDLATALIQRQSVEVEQAVRLGLEALAASTDRPIRSVWQRAHELGDVIGAISTSASRDYLRALHDWSSSARSFAAPAGG
ncbi:hypothetical protein ACQPZ2_27980 [Nocardia pseudovaccinii]|uniref:hypothetical protein n=1 Tax=Nocardia pseudovaccinii TaxID=189540 RepID=UPI003D950212